MYEPPRVDDKSLGIEQYNFYDIHGSEVGNHLHLYGQLAFDMPKVRCVS